MYVMLQRFRLQEGAHTAPAAGPRANSTLRGPFPGQLEC